MDRVREAVRPYPKAVLFELAEEGFDSPFEQLLACIISIRTYDEITEPTARRLFSKARTPAKIDALTEDEIDQLITACTFHEVKSKQIKNISKLVTSEFYGDLPCDYDILTSFHGIGAKCANLVLGIACGIPKISVDVHVHRVTNRWGTVSTGSPGKSLIELEKILPGKYWVELNKLLVPFGKHICTGRLPHCSTCPVLVWCKQVGVKAHT